VQGNIRNPILVKKLVKDVDAVFHQAALVNVALSVEDPLLFNDVNVVGTRAKQAPSFHA
jgi:nucleoside-diphosphate-sugar epimerase